MEKNEIYSVGLDMIYLAACSLHGRIPEKERLDKMQLATVYKMAKKHSMQAIVYILIAKCREKYGDGIIDAELFAKWKADYYAVVKRLVQFDIERESLRKFLNDNGFWYVCLKGTVLQKYYPALGMRQMADNDILVDPKACPRVQRYMTENGYSCETYGKGCHDTYFKGTLNFEIHRQLFPDIVKTRRGFDYYRNIESRLIRNPESTERFFTDEDFYIYFLYHSYKHYVIAGCGVRTLMDIFVYLSNNAGKLREDYLKQELEKIGICELENDLRALAFKLFSAEAVTSDVSLDESERKMLEYIVLSGTFGTQENLIRNRVSDISGESRVTLSVKLRYLWKRIFPDMDYYKSSHPKASRFIVTIPFLWFIRLLRGIRKAKKYAGEVKYIDSMDNNKADSD